MFRLHEIQQAFAEGVIEGKHHVLTGSIAPRGSALRSVALYRRLIRTNYTQVLSATYPVLRRFVGPRYFDVLARGYVKKYPSTSGDLFSYGRHLPGWLLELQVPRLLVELSRLEWTCHEVYQATDSLPLPQDQLDPIASADPWRVTFHLNTTVRLLRFSLPVHRVWLALQPDSAEDIAVDLPLPEEETAILVTRAEGKICVASLAPLDYRLIQAMACGTNAAEIEQMALETDPGFDFTGFLASILELNVLVGVSVEVIS